MKNTVVQLTGGGLDSAALTILDHREIDHLLHINYGQRAAEGEYAAVMRLWGAFDGIYLAGRSCATLHDANRDNPLFGGHSEDGFIYGRNLTLLVEAANAFLGTALNRDNGLEIRLGLCEETMMFPDADSGFIARANALFGVAYNRRVRVTAPYIFTPKREYLQRALDMLDRLKLDHSFLWDAWTCWTPRAGRECGTCYHCTKRAALRAEMEQ